MSALCACGGSQPQPESAEAPAESVETAPPAAAAEEPAPEAEKAPEKKPEAEVPEPQFTDNMSVADAMKAVPQGADRKNIEQEALAKPFQDPKTFESCKVGSGHFKLKVAVWNGKAVGVDVTTTPKNQKLTDCLTARIKEIDWPDKVKSLNTVEFQF
ncbi:MAG TPA: hypothetical protein VGK73_13320 [Polyangiaceae bacterium]